MPLILAIEPDRRQAARIAAIARAQLKAELVVADSTERAIAGLNGRVPDLILTSPLLSPKDEARLRDLDAVSPVQTLTIPVLAASARASEPSGLLARLTWSRTGASTTAGGCDPALFGAQIAEYLHRAAVEREHSAEIAAPTPTPQPTLRLPRAFRLREVLPKTDVAETEAVRLKPDTTEMEEVRLKPDTTPLEEVQLRLEKTETEEISSVVDATPIRDLAAAEAGDIRSVRLQPDLEAASDAAVVAELVEPTKVPDPEIELVADQDDSAAASVEARGTSAKTAYEWEEISLDSEAIELTSETIDLEAFVEELESTYTARVDTPEVSAENAAASIECDRAPAGEQEVEAAEAVIDEPIVEMDAVAEIEAAVAALAEPADEEPLVGDLEQVEPVVMLAVASPLPPAVLWPRIEGLLAEEEAMADEIVAEFEAGLECEADADDQNEPAAVDEVDDSELWMPLSPAIDKVWPRLETQAMETSGVQDEWGFFDPDRCGFSALLAKLDQLTR